MADDFDERLSELADGENRLAELFRQVTLSLDALVEKTRRLGDVFDAIAPVGRSPGLAAAALPGAHPAASAASGSSSAGMQATVRNPATQRGQDRTAVDNARANQRTAQAVEELVRNGIKLHDFPPAIYGE